MSRRSSTNSMRFKGRTDKTDKTDNLSNVPSLSLLNLNDRQCTVNADDSDHPKKWRWENDDWQRDPVLQHQLHPPPTDDDDDDEQHDVPSVWGGVYSSLEPDKTVHFTTPLSAHSLAIGGGATGNPSGCWFPPETGIGAGCKVARSLNERAALLP